MKLFSVILVASSNGLELLSKQCRHAELNDFIKELLEDASDASPDQYESMKSQLYATKRDKPLEKTGKYSIGENEKT